MGEENTDD